MSDAFTAAIGCVVGIFIGATLTAAIVERDIEPENVPAPAPTIVVVERAPCCCPERTTIDVTDDLYPPADDEPPQRPWQELRRQKETP